MLPDGTSLIWEASGLIVKEVCYDSGPFCTGLCESRLDVSHLFSEQGQTQNEITDLELFSS